MDRVAKRYLTTLVLGIAFLAIVGVIAWPIIESDDPIVGKIMIIGSFVFTGTLVAREKGRTLLYGLAGWIAPLLLIVLLLPHTKERREDLMKSE